MSNPNPPEFSRFLREQAAAEFLGLSPRTLQGLRIRGGGPEYLRPAGCRVILYEVQRLVDWAEAGKRSSTSDPGAEANR